MDEDEDGLINFKEFSQLCGLICRGEFYQRIKLLYRMHLPSKDTPSVETDSKKDIFEVVENASEATEHSDEESNSDETLVVVPRAMGIPGQYETEGEIIVSPSSSSPLAEAVISSNQSSIQEAISSIEDGGNVAGAASSDSVVDADEPKTELCASPPVSKKSEAIDFETRSLSPNTSEYILSKSPRSAKKLVKDFVASVTKGNDTKKDEELPDMMQV